MARVLKLDDEDVELLGFILDMTIEEWEHKEPANIDFVSTDRTVKDAETMLALVRDIQQQNSRLRAMRDRLALREQT